jgi:flagellar operon protein
MSQNPFLYPSVTSIPSQGVGEARERIQPRKTEPGEFDKALDQVLVKDKSKTPPESRAAGLTADLGMISQPLKFSTHAAQRMQERKIKLDEPTMAKVNEAVRKAEAKGLEDTLILTGDAALIVSVKNKTVITAMDKAQLTGNVFTNIDGAVIV